MTEGKEQMVDSEYTVEAGALREVPVWEEHVRGRNWLAKIHLNPKAPGGLDREFCEKAGGDYYYVVEGIGRGDALEFAGDYFTGGGNRYTSRFYAAVVNATESTLTLRVCDTAREAVEEARRIRTEDVAAEKPDDLSEDERSVARKLAEMPEDRVIAILEARRKLADAKETAKEE